jgi:hypothetical protein
MSFARSILLPSFASLSASLLPIIFVWALTLYRYVLAVRFLSMFTMDASIVLSGWLFCSVGCLIWVLMRYSELRLSVNMCVGSLENSWIRICRVW